MNADDKARSEEAYYGDTEIRMKSAVYLPDAPHQHWWAVDTSGWTAEQWAAAWDDPGGGRNENTVWKCVSHNYHYRGIDDTPCGQTRRGKLMPSGTTIDPTDLHEFPPSKTCGEPLNENFECPDCEDRVEALRLEYVEGR